MRMSVVLTGLVAATLSTATAADPSRARSAAALDEEWRSSAAGLVRRCEAGGHAELAAFIAGWRLPDEEARQFVIAIPPHTTTPEWIDSSDERAIWEAFLAARRAQAQAALAAAAATAAAADERRPREANADGGPPEAVRLLYRALRDDPDNERAREAAGWVRRKNAWVWPEAARRLDRGEEYSADFGWLPRGHHDRYRGGERHDRGRWIRAGAAAVPTDPARGWTFASDHWQITSTAGTEPAAALAADLELTRTVWRQVFGGYEHDAIEWSRRLAGRSPPASTGRRLPHAAMLVADRPQYVAALEHVEPMIARTLGIYWTPTRTAWFFDGEGRQATTVHHEAAHQLFAETRRTSPLAGERCGFWAIEAAACYLESLEPTDFGWTVGGRDAGRAAVARERLLEDGFHVPLAELTALGRREFQTDERLPQIYSEISGLADFFMNGEHRRYRAAFVEYLTRIYTGTVDTDTLARLCGTAYPDLDDAYRRHMAR